MLYNKEQINNKIDEFKSYCEQQENFKMIKWDSFFTLLYSAVSDYFNSNNEDVSREVAGSGTFLLVDGQFWWSCTGASTGTKFVHSANNGSRIHKIYGLAKLY